jgi:hypothetical protein
MINLIGTEIYYEYKMCHYPSIRRNWFYWALAAFKMRQNYKNKAQK